jgi:hypothetical protein
MTNKENFALILMKEENIIQIRTMNTTKEKAIQQAKLVKSYGNVHIDNVIVYKTVPHKKPAKKEDK